MLLGTTTAMAAMTGGTFESQWGSATEVYPLEYVQFDFTSDSVPTVTFTVAGTDKTGTVVDNGGNSYTAWYQLKTTDMSGAVTVSATNGTDTVTGGYALSYMESFVYDHNLSYDENHNRYYKRKAPEWCNAGDVELLSPLDWETISGSVVVTGKINVYCHNVPLVAELYYYTGDVNGSVPTTPISVITGDRLFTKTTDLLADPFDTKVEPSVSWSILFSVEQQAILSSFGLTNTGIEWTVGSFDTTQILDGHYKMILKNAASQEVLEETTVTVFNNPIIATGCVDEAFGDEYYIGIWFNRPVFDKDWNFLNLIGGLRGDDFASSNWTWALLSWDFYFWIKSLTGKTRLLPNTVSFFDVFTNREYTISLTSWSSSCSGW